MLVNEKILIKCSKSSNTLSIGIVEALRSSDRLRGCIEFESKDESFIFGKTLNCITIKTCIRYILFNSKIHTLKKFKFSRVCKYPFSDFRKK